MTSSRAIFGLVGAGGHGRETMPFVRTQIAARPDLGVDPDRIVFVDREAGPDVGGHRVISEAEFVAQAGERLFAVAIGRPETRLAVAGRLEAAGCRALTVTAATATILDSARVAPGALIAPYALINADVSVGRHLIANVQSSLAHDAVIGDFVTLGPRACVNGGVTIGDEVEIGAGALIRQGLTIGAGAVIGMGAVVVKDVAAGAVVVGNPAREITR
ncbi:acetyltransferase [Brevundimonas sp.]|uniref:acetyltransferase n=1 Tax=Brevundimonas sp. TaxID=1871086 RepID=UPI002610B619|nr:acetyltransferase [Brevundimonas sp.]